MLKLVAARSFSKSPDVVLECVGFHYCNSMLHRLEMEVGLETDTPEIINELITAVRKGGRIGVIGVYVGYANHVNLGAIMEKGLSMAAGQTPVQKYWKHLLKMVRDGTLKPEMIITTRMPLEEAPRAYKMFNDKEEGCLKVVLKPGGEQAMSEQ